MLLSNLLLVFLIIVCVPTQGVPRQSNRDEQEKTTVKYFKTHLAREDLLVNEIDADEANKTNHFRAIYDTRGKLISVEFVPAPEEEKKDRKTAIEFPEPKGPFRYFEKWNPHLRELKKAVSKSEIGEKPFYRVTFYDSAHVKSVEYFRHRKRLWTYYINWNNKGESTLSVVFSVHRPLTALDPHLFHPTLSEMKPGWIAKFKHNQLGKPLEVTVRDPLGNLYYFYKFKYRFETVGDTLLKDAAANPTNCTITTSEYYRADSTLMGSHRLIFTEDNSLWKKEYFDVHGKLTESIEYEYNPELKEVSVVIRDPKGSIIHRQVISK